tara:strand:- start:5154 stop:5669 length:516 start_codon:yes stop_codon:yes gene_type:complete
MTFIISPQTRDTTPDNEHEIHTVIIDNNDHSSKVNFTAFLPTPLENVVQARLITATLTTTGYLTQTALHIGVEELRSYFSQRTKSDLESANDNHLNGKFGTIIGNHIALAPSSATKVMIFKDEYPILQEYHTPIRKLDRLTFNIHKQDGDTAQLGDSVFVFKFTCKKMNLS